jgi:hypothetical protein
MKKIGQTKYKERLVEDDLVEQGESLVKLMEMSKEAGIIKERKRIIKLFEFELNNGVTSCNTLEKLYKLKKETEGKKK